MITLKNISNNQEDCERFSAIYYKKSNGCVASVAYLQKGQTYVLYRANQPNEWLGGFCTNTEDGFRYLAGFSPAEASAILQSHALNPKDIIEVGCLWLFSKSISKTERFIFYLRLIIKVLGSGKKVIMGGSFIPKVAELHMKILPHLIHEGFVSVVGKNAVARFYVGYRNQIPLNFLKGLVFDFSKTIKKKLNLIYGQKRLPVTMRKPQIKYSLRKN